ncbi:efflux RND transporter periplasmic adaptor subunit [Marinobacter sediminum]|nr:efflux RND transporter periplasmic adaptor subunit [Marinobacter sediminum]
MWGLVLTCLLTGPAWAQQAPGVQLETVSEETIIQEVSLNGTVNPLRVSRISPAVAGLLDTVRVEAGDRVSKGDVLVELDDEQAVFELEAARAETNQARALLDEAERRLAEARSVGAGRNIAATEVRSRESDVVATRAALARLEAVLKRMAVRVRRHHVEAPFDGVVSERSSDLGEWVTPGDELLRLVDTTNLRLDFQVPQEYLTRLDDGSGLLVRDGQSLVDAEISARIPVTDPQSRTFLLRALQPEATGFWPGMAVQAVLRVSTGEKGLTVSRDAINRYPEGRVTVWIATGGDGDAYAVSEKRIRLGTVFKGRVEVTEGLIGGEQVVVRGNESLTEGITVRIAEREAR